MHNRIPEEGMVLRRSGVALGWAMLVFALSQSERCDGAVQVRRVGEDWEVTGRAYKLVVSGKDGGIVSLSEPGRTGLLVRSDEGGLWQAQFSDGAKLSARSAKEVRGEQTGPGTLRFSYAHPSLQVAVMLSAGEDGVDLIAELTSKTNGVLEMALPGRLRFEPGQTRRLIFPLGGNESVGIALLGRFFERQPAERPAGWEVATVGARGFSRLFGVPLQMRPPRGEAEALRVTEEGQKWLSRPVQRMVSRRRIVVDRPPSENSDLKVLVETEAGRAFFAGKQIGEGTLWLMGGRMDRPEHASLQQGLVGDVLAQLGVEGKPIGLIALAGEPAQGSRSAVSLDNWRESLSALGRVVLLQDGEALQRALSGRSVVAVVNPYTERLPLRNARDYDEMIGRIEEFLRKGGHWFEVGGYPFRRGLVPAPYYRRVEANYPPAFADFLHLDSRVGSVSLYRAQARDWSPWAGQKEHGAVFVPGQLACGADEQGGYLERQFVTALKSGQTWKTPPVRLQVGSTPEKALADYAQRIGLRRRLADKMSPEVFEKFKSAVLVRMVAGGEKPVQSHLDALPYLPVPSLVHFSEYLPLGFDRPYPIHLPPSERYGTAEELRGFLKRARSLGHLVMPYTNPTWFPDKSPIWEREGTAREALAFGPDGKPQREHYAAESGYSICFWHPLVQRYNRETIRLFTEEYPVDIVFQDQCGARRWRFDGNPASPTPYAYTEGMLSMVAEDSARVRRATGGGLATEGGWDQVVEFEVQLCGLSFGIVPTQPRRPHLELLKEKYAPELWRVYPLAQILAHDKVLMTMHNLAGSVSDRQILAWVLGLGFGLQHRLPADTLSRSESARQWLNWLSVLQKNVCARYIGEPLVTFEHHRDDPTAAETDDGVIRATYGPVRIVANLNSQPLQEGEHRLAAYGFVATATNLLAGNLQQVAGHDHGTEGISFVLARRGADALLWVYGPAAQKVALPWDGGGSQWRVLWDDGRQTTASVEGGALIFHLPDKPAHDFNRVWHAKLQRGN
ncbi:MAG: hypothetical protein N3I86_00610 [Verrucomicrobiae bacterium]|nr:hypothetical protein [Verrucomicrobiae bacterium]